MLLTTNGFLAEFKDENVEKICEKIRDICLISDSELLLISEDGSVQIQDLHKKKLKTLKVNPLVLKQPKFISCSNSTLIDTNGQVWFDPEDLKVNEFLSGNTALNSVSGSDFTLVLVKKSTFSSQENSPEEALKCPLGLPLQKEDEQIVLRKKIIKESEEEGQEQEAKVERLAKSGIYINPSDALKFLSTQLSWIRESSEPQKPLNIAQEDQNQDQDQENPITKATSFVKETVSKLSKTFSIDKNLSDTIALGPIEASSQVSETVEASEPAKAFKIKGLSHRRSQSVTSFKSAPKKLEFAKKEDIFQREIWSWGKNSRGQLGQGDMLDRNQPSPIKELTGLGVVKIVSGTWHSLALTITGQVFGWGDNNLSQSCPQNNFGVCLTPKMINLPTGETASDIAANSNKSFVLTDIGNIYFFEERRLVKIEFLEENSVRKILAPDSNLICISISQDSLLPLKNFKALEKRFLYKMREMCKKVIEPLCTDSKICSEDVQEAKNRLLEISKTLIELLSESILNSWEFSRLEDCLNLSLVKKNDEFCKIFEAYSKSFCDILAGSCFEIEPESKMATVIGELLANLCHIHLSETSTHLEMLLLEPISQVDHYITCLRAIYLAGRNSEISLKSAEICEKLEKIVGNLEKVSKNSERDLKSLRRTQDFWDNAGSKLVQVLRKPKRRLILDSKECFLNISHATSFGKHWFLLFNDIFVHAGYASHLVHPLQTVWVENIDKKSAKNVENSENHEITLILPEETLVLTAPNHENKNEWIVSINRSIIETLGASDPSIKNFAPPILRHTSYNFYKLADTKGAVYEGAWLHGKLHGQGKFTWPDGRIYQGQFRQNQKHGVGKLQIPGNSIFEGQWKFDKFDGHGKISFANGDVYKGKKLWDNLYNSYLSTIFMQRLSQRWKTSWPRYDETRPFNGFWSLLVHW